MEKLDGKTLDLTKENINTLKALFPEVVSEGKVDFEKLKLVLGEEVDNRKEKYEFTWHGKAQSLKLAQTPSTGTLRPDKESSKDWDETENLYIEGDNLEVLKLLQKSYFGKVKMIYIDPPYNTGHDFIYKDDFRDNIKNYKEVTEQLTKSNSETSGRYHTDWLNLMYPRLKLARNLLKEDGVIFISIDDNELSNITKVCDEIFGEDNRISIISREAIKGGSVSKHIRVTHDYVLVYVKNETLVQLTGIETDGIELNLEDEKGKFARGRELNKWGAGSRREDSPSMWFPIPGPNGEEVYPIRNDGSEGRWRLGKEKMFKLVSEGDVIFEKRDNGTYIAYQKIRDSSPKIKQFTTLFLDDYINSKGTEEIKRLFEVERAIFDYSKPVKLIKDLITMANLDERDIVLDFFSGSATTAQAVFEHNSDTNKSISFIAVQLDEKTVENSEASKLGYKNICEIGKDRIHRAGDKIVEETGKTNLDTGFKVFKLDTSNLKTWDPDTENLEQDLFDLQDNIKDGRSKQDLLFELLLKVGIPLTTPIEEVKLNDKVIYNVGFGGVLLCLEDEIDLDTVHKMIKLKPEDFDTKVIFKETGFLNDSVKTNAIQTLKKNGITDVRSV